MPRCTCFDGFAGADCGLVAKRINLGEAEQVTLLQGTSLLLEAKVNDPQLHLSVSELSGEIHVYTMTLNRKVMDRQSE